jgi:adenylosuccinate synthase
MITGQAVIGANYGDEGKGLMTDYFASEDPEHSLVVRFNGGAQAGHTVVCPDGRRHVFSHFGAGTFVGCPTYLSQFFIVNPMLFLKELKSLGLLAVRPLVYIDAGAFVTTPFDMFINQMVEARRGAIRHGSCGLGINETMNRSLRSQTLQIRARDLLNPDALLGKLLWLGKTWLDMRLSEHHLDPNAHNVIEFKEKMELIVLQFTHDVGAMLEHAIVSVDYPVRRKIIFEGAQGLMLDEDRIDQWPHVTRSKTGLTNVVFLAKKLGVDVLQVTYVTRSYLTRHGAGPLSGECDWSFPDQTNVVNAFQGTLRFAPLDCKQLRESIRMDFQYARLSFPNLQGNVAVTCADQLAVPIFKADLPVAYVSCGTVRSDVRAFSACRI